MTLSRAVVVVLALSWLGPAPGSAQTQPSAEQLEADKRVVMEFYRPGITNEERYELLHEGYIQHNARYVKYGEDHNLSGKEAFLAIRQEDARNAAATGRVTGPAPPPPGAPQGNTFHILYAEGDLVVRIAQRWRSHPTDPGAFYETFWWDTFRVRDGKLYEHWDAAIIEPPASGDGGTR